MGVRVIDNIAKRRYNTYMNKALDIALGWPGLVVFVVLIFVGIANTADGVDSKTKCEAQGGKYVQTMKSYHTCKMLQTAV